MNLQEYHQLLAEQGTLNHLLEQLDEDRVLERMGLKSRLERIESLFANHPIPNRQPARARLTFRGKPVIGSHGIFADFGANAVGAFEKAVATISASLKTPLGERGTLADREDYRLLITNTALGSFGFELEEAPNKAEGMLFPENSLVETALEQTLGILEALRESDKLLTEALVETDTRAVKRIQDFLDILAKEEAVCALAVKDRTFRFKDPEEVRRCAARLSQDNIHEESIELTGSFLGVLPDQGQFEFRPDDNTPVISGKISKDIESPAAINQLLDRPMVIEVRQRQVGKGRRTHVLVGYKDPSNLQEAELGPST